MEIITERLEREFDLDLVTTAPSVVYHVYTLDGQRIVIDNPSNLPNKPRFSNAGSRRIIDEEELLALLDDLKATIPEDIRRASGIIAEKENTLRDANEQADQIVADAQKEANELHEQAQEAAENVYRQAVAEYEGLVSESAVYQAAVKRAEDLRQAAEENADSICSGARSYADDILADVQRYLNDYMKMINGNGRPSLCSMKWLTVVSEKPRNSLRDSACRSSS